MRVFDVNVNFVEINFSGEFEVKFTAVKKK